MPTVSKPRTQLPPEWAAHVYLLERLNIKQANQLSEYDEKFKDAEINDELTKIYFSGKMRFLSDYNEIILEYQEKLKGYIMQRDDMIASLRAQLESLESRPCPPDTGAIEALTLEVENLKRYNSELQHKISCMKPSYVSYSVSVQTDNLTEEEDDIPEPERMAPVVAQTEDIANAERLVETITELLRETRKELEDVKKNAGQYFSYMKEKAKERVKSHNDEVDFLKDIIEKHQKEIAFLKDIIEKHKEIDLERNTNYEQVFNALKESQDKHSKLKNSYKKLSGDYIRAKDELKALKRRNAELSLYDSIVTRSCVMKQKTIQDHTSTMFQLDDFLQKMADAHKFEYDSASLGYQVITYKIDECNKLKCEIMAEVSNLNQLYPSDFHKEQLDYCVMLFLETPEIHNFQQVLEEIKQYKEMLKEFLQRQA